MSQGSSSAASAAREESFSPRTWSGWIPFKPPLTRRDRAAPDHESGRRP
ncbi:hypothetical protein GOA57_13825 [Sinorhizobium meliloti]|nr:hypothetical protein [Sinorhizobium meliloti]